MPGTGITSASLRLQTPYGEVASSWRSTPDGLTLDVTIPPNTTASIRIPARDGTTTVKEVASGTYHFTAG
ncbi:MULTISPECIES: alpha-L-rhamnosidase C-terminal domain-containing protein [unclassified Kribbella]|uniref:alpha-L-rhamnosidase C-terminal domain-containing protein n=1 Tax=unclassified Kribbella TaxID=2644121 RepID=UPI0030170270